MSDPHREAMREAAAAVDATLYEPDGLTPYVTCPDFPSPCAELPGRCRQSLALDELYAARRATQKR